MGMVSNPESAALVVNDPGFRIDGRIPTEAEKSILKYQSGDKSLFALPITGLKRLGAARKAGTIDIRGILAQKAQAAITNTPPAPAPVVTQAPQPQAVNQTGSSASGHGQAQPVKKQKKAKTRGTVAQRQALLFDRASGGLG